MKVKEENKIILVAGVINATGKMLFWTDKAGVSIGDYAIAQNMNGYDLIKVVGIIETTKKDASKFSNTKCENMKSTIVTLNREIFN